MALGTSSAAVVLLSAVPANAGRNANASPEIAPKVAAAKPPRGAPARPQSACAAAADAAEQHEKAGGLRAARESALTCAKASCGPALQRACSERFTRLDSTDVPSVVFVVKDATGARLVDVEVKMDSEPLSKRVDGQPIDVDPGLHEFSFRSTSGAVATRKMMIAQGQRAMLLVVSLGGASQPAQSDQGKPAALPPAPSSPVPETPAPSPPVAETPAPIAPAAADETNSSKEPPRDGQPRIPLVVAGLSVAAGLGAGALFVAAGSHDSWFTASKVLIGSSVGIGVAAIGLVSWLFATSGNEAAPPPAMPTSASRVGHEPAGDHPSRQKSEGALAPRSSSWSWGFDVSVTPSRTLASLSGAF